MVGTLPWVNGSGSMSNNLHMYMVTVMVMSYS